MALWLIYQMFSKLLGWIVLRARPDGTKEVEILVLRHQLAVLLAQLAAPRELYTRPATSFVARFVGGANVANAELATTLAGRLGESLKAFDALFD